MDNGYIKYIGDDIQKYSVIIKIARVDIYGPSMQCLSMYVCMIYWPIWISNILYIFSSLAPYVCMKFYILYFILRTPRSDIWYLEYLDLIFGIENI